MIDAAVDALVRAAPAGVTSDGLEAERTDGSFRFAVPGTERSDLGDAAFRTAARAHPDYTLEWYAWEHLAPAQPAGRALCRWLEDAPNRPVPVRLDTLLEGCRREWGQLGLHVRADESHRRRYEVRHRADDGVPRARLGSFRDPAAVRDHVRTDDDGRYRPLSTAPTLPTGWVAVDLDPAAFVRTVDAVYPATVANWHREREGDLDVTHWREAAERQTGLFDLVDELADEQVAWLAEACCVDSQCVKRREWDDAGGGDLEVPRGTGEFPCREPCSLVIAAAREIALAERAEPDSITLRLTATERTQFERMLDAVAEGAVPSVRDGDLGDGANRLRARYLRAKHGGPDGRLGSDDPGEPT